MTKIRKIYGKISTGHWTSAPLSFIKGCFSSCVALRAHAELLNYDFPPFAGRPDNLKSIMQLCLTRPSLQNQSSFRVEGTLTKANSSGGNKMKNDFEIHFWELSERVRLHINDEYLKNLFDKASDGGLYKLAKTLNISYPFIIALRRGVYSIPSKILVQLAIEANEDLYSIEDQIKEIGTRAGTKCKIKFPIKTTSQMASLVGHVFGDGYIGNKKRQFEYCNDNINLLNEVRENVKIIFGLDPMTERINRIGYPTIVGEVLVKFGAHFSPKIRSEKLVPEWVKFGSIEYKRAFIRSLFNDDGSVLFSENYKAKGVNYYQIRHKDLTETSQQLLQEIKEMLEDFDVFSGKPHTRNTYVSHGEEHTISYINITNTASIINFHNRIGLAEGNKFNRLKKIIKRDGGIVLKDKPKKVLVLGSGALKIGEAGESA